MTLYWKYFTDDVCQATLPTVRGCACATTNTVGRRLEELLLLTNPSLFLNTVSVHVSTVEVVLSQL